MASEPILSKITLFGHPLHPALIHFPVAALIGAVAADLAYVFTADGFWARAGLWLVGIGTLGGWVSGTVGFLDLVIVTRIRRLVTAWCHAVLAIMLLSVASLNWLLRFDEAQLHILPWGLYLSLLTGALIALTSFLGGQLVYEHAVGVHTEDATPGVNP